MTNFRIRRIGVVVVGVLGLVAGATHIVVTQSDPQVGTWVLDVARSSFSPGPALRSQTAVYAAAPNGLKVAATGTDAGGKPTHVEFTVTFDGKDHPATGSPEFTSIAATRVDSHTIAYTRQGAGGARQDATRAVSRDGKIATLTVTGVDGQGRTITNVQVYTRQ